MGVVVPKLRQSARGQNCTFAIPGVCTHDPETVVLCHIRDEATGKATKANDWSAAFGCYACHEYIDHNWLDLSSQLFYMLRAMQRTQRIWYEMGLMSFPTKEPKPKQSSKILPRRQIIHPEEVDMP